MALLVSGCELSSTEQGLTCDCQCGEDTHASCEIGKSDTEVTGVGT